jgi:peptide deformylase
MALAAKEPNPSSVERTGIGAVRFMTDEPVAEIVVYPDSRLRQVCEPFDRFDGELKTLAERMVRTMRAGNGIGLAGPQIGVMGRIFVCNVTGKPQDDLVFVNPELYDLSGAVEAEEGCLSIPDVTVTVRRARRCRMQAQDVQGRPVDAEAEDLLARVWQHECDHLDGGLIIDRMNGSDRIANKRILTEMESRAARQRSTR